ncbi:RNA 2'-phosphotransferase [Hugenholtzia roseola]|uniref:RNA 2'-phosphotransferase n=1 Tax=Hugenholtzia roseola TaxID=1002 RepID=UPI000412E856|nr:RNA 2'-phosphotransferase [Hugenholtzia roseola]
METKNFKKISKFLSLLLRHRPEVVGLELDQAGWARVADLLLKVKAHKPDFALDLPTLAQLVAENDKQRFSFDASGTKIRANQGHSIAKETLDLGLLPQTPPSILYHGTSRNFLDSIKKEGLQKKTRQYVHLSADVETATKVGSRKGNVRILIIKALEMQKAGHSFYRAQNGVWLAEEVPPSFIEFGEAF